MNGYVPRVKHFVGEYGFSTMCFFVLWLHLEQWHGVDLRRLYIDIYDGIFDRRRVDRKDDAESVLSSESASTTSTSSRYGGATPCTPELRGMQKFCELEPPKMRARDGEISGEPGDRLVLLLILVERTVGLNVVLIGQPMCKSGMIARVSPIDHTGG